MNITAIFTEQEIELITIAYNPRNGNIVFGTAFRLDFFDRLGLFEESRQHFLKEFKLHILERYFAIDFLKRELEGRKVIELGPGPFKEVNGARDFAALGALEYVAVEPALTEKCASEINEHFRTGPGTILVPYSLTPFRAEKVAIPVSICAEDGLSYLLKQPDESAVVFSSCLFREDSLTDVGLPSELAAKYLHCLISEIYRVTPKNCVSIHADNSPYIRWDDIFKKSGFNVMLLGTSKMPEVDGIAATEDNELSYVIGSNGLILRK